MERESSLQSVDNRARTVLQNCMRCQLDIWQDATWKAVGILSRIIGAPIDQARPVGVKIVRREVVQHWVVELLRLRAHDVLH